MIKVLDNKLLEHVLQDNSRINPRLLTVATKVKFPRISLLFKFDNKPFLQTEYFTPLKPNPALVGKIKGFKEVYQSKGSTPLELVETNIINRDVEITLFNDMVELKINEKRELFGIENDIIFNDPPFKCLSRKATVYPQYATLYTKTFNDEEVIIKYDDLVIKRKENYYEMVANEAGGVYQIYVKKLDIKEV